MLQVVCFEMNPFQENTFLLVNENQECIIIDPGCSNAREERILLDYISDHGLHPVRLINTHCHIDHVLGNHALCSAFHLTPECHALEQAILDMTPAMASMFGVPYSPSPVPARYLDETDVIPFGNASFSLIHCPGHSPGSLCLYERNEKILIAGDVLFYGSIGRTDLPYGDYDTLIRSIREKLWVLPDEVKVYSGHGQETTLGFEKRYNPFLME